MVNIGRSNVEKLMPKSIVGSFILTLSLSPYGWEY